MAAGTEPAEDEAPPLAPGEERARWLSRLAAATFDLIVIGGGVTGCGVARDAALRGLSVALLEKSDFAAGTSSKSSKLVHGGLRYLEHGQLRLVFEGTNERALLLRRAPHLVRPLEFLVPAYRGSRHGVFRLDVGLWIYDALSRFSSPRMHRTYRAAGIRRLEPELREDGLEGGVVYYDAITDDARLTLETALDARALGAVTLNHVEVRAFLREGERVVGVEARDLDPGSGGGRLVVRGRLVVSAGGPWTDELRGLLGERAILRPSRGVHAVVDAARLDVRHAVVMGASDGRVMFAIPWGPRTMLGTTDTFDDARPDDVVATAGDIAYLLDTVNRYFPRASLTPDDVLATWAGLRPLVAPEAAAEITASDVSREHLILESPGLLTVAGGKLTTYRRIAAEVVDRAQRALGGGARSETAERPLPGAAGLDGDRALEALVAELRGGGLDDDVAHHLALTYGVRARRILARVARDPEASARLDPELPHLVAEIDEAVEHELARRLVDVLGRRVPLLLRARDQGLAAAPRVAARIGLALGFGAAREREEVERYREVVARSRRFRTP